MAWKRCLIYCVYKIYLHVIIRILQNTFMDSHDVWTYEGMVVLDGAYPQERVWNHTLELVVL